MDRQAAEARATDGARRAGCLSRTTSSDRLMTPMGSEQRPPTPRCPACASPLPPKAAYCPRCGAPMAGAPAAVDQRTGAGVAAAEAVAPLRRPLRLGQTIAGVAAGLAGVLLLGGPLLLVIGSVPDPVALWLSTVAAAAPAILYSLLVVSFDRLEREPWRLLLGAFGWGAVVAALFSALVGAITGGVLSAAYGEQAGTLLNVGLGAPFIEETFKGV